MKYYLANSGYRLWAYDKQSNTWYFWVLGRSEKWKTYGTQPKLSELTRVFKKDLPVPALVIVDEPTPHAPLPPRPKFRGAEEMYAQYNEGVRLGVAQFLLDLPQQGLVRLQMQADQQNNEWYLTVGARDNRGQTYVRTWRVLGTHADVSLLFNAIESFYLPNLNVARSGNLRYETHI